MLNPILQAIRTEQTCGDACWKAREDICRCSCAGRNHGCLRGKDGEQPARTRRVKEYFYQLAAVSAYDGKSCLADMNRPIHLLERQINKRAIATGIIEERTLWSKSWHKDIAFPVLVKTASEDEVNRWPELAAWREAGGWRPLTLWVRQDLMHLVEEPKEEQQEAKHTVVK